MVVGKLNSPSIKSILKQYVWAITHLPVSIMVLMLIYDPTQWKLLTPYSGYFAVSFFVLTLSLNPLKSLKPKWIWILKLNRHRREFGVASFFYALLHFMCFLVKRGSIQEALPYFSHPAIIPALYIAFPILLILAITSNQYFIRKLSFPKWKQLHKKVYLAEPAIILHMVLIGDLLFALLFFVPLSILQFLRIKKTALKSSTNL